MSPTTQLQLAATAFAVVWTALMAWWNVVNDVPGMTVLAATGALAGIGWYFGVKCVSTLFYGRQWT